MDIGKFVSFVVRFVGAFFGLTIALVIFGAAFNVDDDFADMMIAAFFGVFIYDALMGKDRA